MERSEFDFKEEYIDRTGELQGNNYTSCPPIIMCKIKEN